MLRKRILASSPTSALRSASNKRLKTDDSQDTCLNAVDNSSSSPSNVSKYFSNLPKNELTTIDSQVLQLQIKLNNDLKALDIIKPPIEYMYNPLEYAFKPNEMYVRKYCTTKKKLLFIGLNPGPFGMCQTGVPFGDPKWVRNWLKIEGEVSKPPKECPERKVIGLSSEKTEVSGDKLWGLFSKLCGSPEVFFKDSFVINLCPLAFMKHDGKNITPGEIKNVQDRTALISVCDTWCLNLIQLLEPEKIIAIGRFVENVTNEILKRNKIKKEIIYMIHPSPRIPNNSNWPEKAEKFLHEKKLMSFFVKE